MTLLQAGTHQKHIFSQNGTVCHNQHAVQKSAAKTVVENPGIKLQDSGTLRERKHEFVCREIERAAWDLFASVGFDRATVESISRDAGVSRRTFFRYFRSKEDLLSASIQDFGERIARRFAEAPVSRNPLAALEAAMLAIAEEEIDKTRQPQEMIGLMFEEPQLRGRFLHALSRWVPALSEELARRKAYRGDEARCDLVAALYCTAFDQAHLRWFRDPDRDLESHLKRAFRQLREASRTAPGG